MDKPSTEQNTAFLDIRGLGKRYGLSAWVIRDFSHTFKKGSITGLIGPNGSGKTTFIRMLTASAFPTEGQVLFRGMNIHEKPGDYLRHIGLAGDVSGLPEYLSAVEVLEWILRSRKIWADDASPSRISDLLDSLELDERREALIGTYSSGMMQKTLIAAALIAEPELIILDEPFRALDKSARDCAIKLLQDYQKNGGTIIISSHLQSLLEILTGEQIRFPKR